MNNYASFYLDAPGSIVQLECIEISHPSFSQVYRYVRNDEDGVIAGGNAYLYQPMSIKRNNVTNDLEQTTSITFADMDDSLADAIKDIQKSQWPRERPKFALKIFRDDDLGQPIEQLQTLEIPTVSKNSEGLMTFDAQAPELNSVKTGLLYTFKDYPLLRGI